MRKNIPNQHSYDYNSFYKRQTILKLEALRKKDMTYILGARCSDGVVLVGDTKITIDNGADYSYSKKLFKPFRSVVLGASGLSGLYKSFQDRMIVAVQNWETQGVNLNSHEKLSLIAEEVIRSMHNIYGEDRYLISTNLSVLMGIRTGEKAELTAFSGQGIPEPVNEIKVIGHGEPYGTIFTKNGMWKRTMTMEETAKLGLFIIKVITDMKLDSTVGYSTEFLPQVYYIPDIVYPSTFDKEIEGLSEEEIDKKIAEIQNKYPIRELSEKEVQSLIDKISSTKTKLDSFFKNGQLKI